MSEITSVGGSRVHSLRKSAIGCVSGCKQSLFLESPTLSLFLRGPLTPLCTRVDQVDCPIPVIQMSTDGELWLDLYQVKPNVFVLSKRMKTE